MRLLAALSRIKRRFPSTVVVCVFVLALCFAAISFGKREKVIQVNCVVEEQQETLLQKHEPKAREMNHQNKEVNKTLNGAQSDNEKKPDRLEQRRQKIQKICQLFPELQSMNTTRSFVSAKHQFLYCPVAKVASSFWSRFFYQLEHTDPVQSPFDIPVSLGFKESKRSFFKSEAKGNMTRYMELIKPMTKFVFVRDPLSRIFSAYIDKMLAPNPIMWKQWAMPAVARLRGVKKQDIKNCGKDISFSEFVSHVIFNLSRVNPHLIPIYQICPPCNITFTIIGKIETAKEDAISVINALNISENQIGFHRMKEDAAADALYDSSHDSLSKSWLNKKCAGKEEVLKRILRKLQIRGFISWRFKFNLTPKKAEEITEKEFINLLSKATRMFKEYESELKVQKKQAFLEAFNEITLAQLNALERIYKHDFKMFGYEDTMKRIRNPDKHIVDTRALDWNRDWDLSAVL